MEIAYQKNPDGAVIRLIVLELKSWVRETDGDGHDAVQKTITYFKNNFPAGAEMTERPQGRALGFDTNIL